MPNSLTRVVLCALVAVSVMLGACTRNVRKTLVPDVPQSGDKEAYSRFQSARAKFLRDGTQGGELARIAEDYPDDPIAPFAQLWAGIAATKDRKFDVAETQLEKVIEAAADPGLTLRAEMFLGIVKNYRGDPAGALPLLQRTAKAVENDAERTEYLAAFAYASAAGKTPLASLAAFDQLWVRSTPTERALIVARVESVVASADPQQLRRAFDELADRKGPSLAVVASRLVLLADEGGRASEAQRLREAAAPARAAVGLPRTIGVGEGGPASAGGDSGLVGAVMPLGGKQNRIGEDAVAGLGLAAGVSDGRAVVAIEVRAANVATGSATAVDDLARANVIAIVGPIDGASVDAAGGRAEGLGIPLLSLATRPEERTIGKFVFHMRHSAEARARSLAQRAIAKGVKKFAVLLPDSGYGKAVTGAFESEVTKAGGQIVIKVSYPADTKSFASFAGKLGSGWDGVFVPEQADKLGLITPALAAAGKVPKPVGTKKVPGGRPVLLLSTAEGLSASYLADAGRHSEGAMFAPGFYPDDQDAAHKPFVDRYVASYGRAPGATEAYAYDAAQLAAAAGGSGRAGLAAVLAKGELAGLTGMIRFDQDHRRSDPGVIYTVVDEAGTFAVRAAR